MKNYQRHFVFDCDDVLANCRDVLQETVRYVIYQQTGESVDVKWQDWADFYGIGKQYKLNFADVMAAMVSRHDLEFMKPEPYAPELTQWCKQNDVSVTVITARGFHPNAQFITERYFQFHNIHVDNVIIVSPTESKRDVMATLGHIDAYIEDNHLHAEQAEGLKNVERVFLMDRPWNKNVDFGIRVSNLRDVLEFFDPTK